MCLLMDKIIEMAIRSDNLSLMQVLDALVSEYENSIQGPGKWQKLAAFLQQRFVKILLCAVFLGISGVFLLLLF